MLRQVYQVNMTIIAKGMRNRPSRLRGSITENLAVSLPKYVVLGYERKRMHLISNTNNTLLQTILRKHNVYFHRRTGETCRGEQTGSARNIDILLQEEILLDAVGCLLEKS
jgi:hypothetical protein